MTTISDPSAMTPDDPRWLSWFMQQRRFDRLSRKAQTGASLITDFASGVYEMGYPGQRRGSYELSDIVKVSRSTGGGRFNSSGVYEWVGNNVPRITYDPVTLKRLGQLIEEQRTNLLTYSSDFANAVWVKRGTFSVTPNAAISPDGTANATLVTGLNTNNNDMYRQGINSGGLAAEVRCEPSVYVKKVTQTGTVNISNAYMPSYGDWTVDLSKVGDGWERITRSHPAVTVVAEFKVHTVGYLGLHLRKTTIGEVSLYIWGAQLEAGSSFPTSYIPTTTAQVTRAADVATVNTLSPWYNASEGTIVVRAISSPSQPASTSETYVAVRGASINDRIEIAKATAQTNISGAVVVGGVTQANLSGATLPPNTNFSAAMSYKSNDFAFSLNGGAVVTDNSGSVPAVTLLQVGSRSSANQCNGIISSITYYPRVINVQQASA